MNSITTKTESQAIKQAEMLSAFDPNYFFYIFHNNSGIYRIDNVGIVYSDEQLLATYKNGQKI